MTDLMSRNNVVTTYDLEDLRLKIDRRFDALERTAENWKCACLFGLYIVVLVGILAAVLVADAG